MTCAILGVTLACYCASFRSAPKPAEPAGGKGSGVLVLHAWWGLNADVKALCKRLADAGFVAFAPDLFQKTIRFLVGTPLPRDL